MLASERIRVTLAAHDCRRIGELVAAGEFTSPAAVVREAVRSWLRRRSEDAVHDACAHRTFDPPHCDHEDVEPVERVELLFDAADAKA